MYRILLSLLTCLLLATSYEILIWGGIIPPSDGIQIWQSNAIKAQRYIYNNYRELNLVLVGSSLTDVIREEYIGDSVKNLAFAGDTSQTGVEVVNRKKSKPPILAVEMSFTMSRGVNEELIDFLYQPLSYWLKLYFPIFREEYRPVSVVVNWIKNIAKQHRQVTEPATEKEQIPNPDLRKRLVEKIVQQWMQPLSEPEIKRLRQQAKFLKEQIRETQKDGVRVVILELPAEATLEKTIRYKQWREIVEGFFPKNNFEWLPPPKFQDWITTDGLHLIRSHAKKYAAFLREQLL